MLKNIYEQKSDISELDFWNQKFLHSCEFLYQYRFKLTDFFQKSIDQSLEYF
jgi:hypothetical protein